MSDDARLDAAALALLERGYVRPIEWAEEVAVAALIAADKVDPKRQPAAYSASDRIDAVAEILGNIYRKRFHKAPTPSQEEREDAIAILAALDALQ